MPAGIGQLDDFVNTRTLGTLLQTGGEARKACYQEAIVRRKFVHNGDWAKEAGWDGPPVDGKYNYPTECDITRYRKPPAVTCTAIHNDTAPLPGLKEDMKDGGKFYALARLELARRFPERASKIFPWEEVGNNKGEYWNGALGELKELDLLSNNADFGLNILLRLIYLYGALPKHLSAPWLDASRIKWDGANWTIPADPNFDPAVQDRVKQALLRFKYWLDDDFHVIDEPKLWPARKGKEEEGEVSVLGGILGGVGGGVGGGLLLGAPGLIAGTVAGAIVGASPSDPYADQKEEMEFISENHQILFATAEYLAGQLYPNEVFRPGENYRSRPKEQYRDLTGREHMAKARKRVSDWLDDRLRFGLSECNAPGYYDEHIAALLNLADFALDESIRQRACMVLDLLIFDLARFNHEGSFSVAAARAHFKHKNNGWGQSVGDLIEIIFGVRGGVYISSDSLAACSFASTRRYQVPDALIAIGRDKPALMIDRSRVSINFDEAADYGIGFEKEPDVFRWWSRAAWLSKYVIDATRKLVKKYGLEKTGVFKSVLPALGTGADVLTGAKLLGYATAGHLFPRAIPLLGNPFTGDDDMADALSIVTEGSAYTRANLYTYRNSDVMLSSAQNHHSGQLSFQGNTCQATLSMCATVFTSHPSAGGGIDQSVMSTLGKIGGGLGGGIAGGLLGTALGGPLGLAGAVFGAYKGGEEGGKLLDKDITLLPASDDGPDWWTGNITQPRVVQIQNAAILAYKPKAFQLLLFGHRFHAWFPQDAFDDLPAEVKGKAPKDENACRLRSEKYFPFLPPRNCNVDTGRWVFGRVGKGYIGLFSAQLPGWTNNGLYACHEIMVEAQRNVFIIQVGNEREFGSYESFKDRVSRARIHINGLNWKLSDFECSYDIPGGARLELHYDDDQVRYGGIQFSDDEFPRIENQFAQVGWLQNKYVIQHKGHSVTHDVRKRQRTTGGPVTELDHEVNLRIYAQNMGLFYAIAPYKGSERDKALQKLINVLRDEKFDVVGLSEMWHEGDRERIARELGNIYKYRLEGPDEFGVLRLANGVAGSVAVGAAGGAVFGPLGALGGGIAGAVAGENVPNNGGLFLLSRHKIVGSNATVFRQCVGEDCGASKGALHARIQVQGVPCGLDVFLSHTQNLTPLVGKRADAANALKAQLRHLAGFVQACRDDRYPALLLGDLNVESLGDREFEKYLHDTMRMDEDLEPTFKPAKGAPAPQHPNATSEDDGARISSFNEGNDARAAVDDKRFGQKAQRLDYFLSWNGAMFKPVYTNRDVVIYQSSDGRDMSDHYGIQTRLATIRQKIPSASQQIKSVTVRLTRFHCLETTSGPGDDEVEFNLRGLPDIGKELSVTTKHFEDVGAGTEESFQAATLLFSDPGSFLFLALNGKEIDSFSADDDLGTSSVWLMRHELLALMNTTTRRTLPRLTGDGGEYAVEVEIAVL